MTNRSGIFYALIVGVLFAGSAYAQDASISIRYGGVDLGPNVNARRADAGNQVTASRIFGGDLVGPKLILGLRPQVSIDKIWSAAPWTFKVTNESVVVNVGVQKCVPLGRAICELFAGVAHFNDKYYVSFIEGDRSTHEYSNWGVAGGGKLRFAFFNHVDAIAGYRYMRRPMEEHTGTSPLGINYRLSGRTTDHCLWVGLSFSVGEV
jgi:hypothetical protein